MRSITVIIMILLLASCTENQRARSFGGKETITLDKNEILLNITWKQDNMWVLTEDTVTHVKHFREHSSFGVMEGEVVINDYEDLSDVGQHKILN